MSHKGIRLLIENTAKKLGDDIQFTYARASDFNMLRDKRYPFISLGLLSSGTIYSVNNTSNYFKTWNVTMAFYELDKMASIQSEYALILDSTDILLDSFIQKLNRNDEITILAINQTPFVKDFTDILTGHILTFQLQVPDDWEYCADGC